MTAPDSHANDLTPMMRQYQAIKHQHPGAILMFRLGDFYEMFNDDAVEVSRLLNLTLTRRGTIKGEDVPMCGVPYHAAEMYIGRLLKHKKRVAICDQVEDARFAKGIVKRAVTRVITPGTTFDERQLTGSANSYLVALYPMQGSTDDPLVRTGVAVLDVTTGLFELAEVAGAESVRQEIVRLQPREILVPPHFPTDEWQGEPAFDAALVVPLDGLYFDDGRNVLLRHFRMVALDGFGCERMTCGVSAAGAALRYAQENFPSAPLEHVRSIRVFNRDKHMILDDTSRRNLELARSIRDGGTAGTLLGVLDETATAMGARMLRQWIAAPLLDVAAITARQDSIEAIAHAQQTLQAIQQTLKSFSDIERLTGRLSTGYGNPRDLGALRASLHVVPTLRAQVGDVMVARAAESLVAVPDAGPDGQRPLLALLAADLADLPDLRALLDRALVDEPPLKTSDGGIIKAGYNAELDELRALMHGGKDWIAQLQIAEADRTGIKSLKVGYNKVFGYYIEVTKANLHLVPQEYIRKQTIANGERFITPDLKEMEARILHAEERSGTLEYDLFQELRMQVLAHTEPLQQIARAVATLDVIQNLAWIALRRNYTRPVVNDSTELDIKAGRHPVVERLLPDQQFVPNDTRINTTDMQIIVLTGPNMSGKSTFIRQTALLTLMAQMGSFIPAASATIGIVDRVFTRVGASDELTRGQSTFMVEMAETANILNNATPRSLIILDEIGRGTSTYDGLAIAWSVIEYLHNCEQVKAKTLFATHYHELVQLESQLPGVVNFNVAVREHEGDVVFLHEIVRGGTDKSYGIHVARLAGVPDAVIERAKAVLQHLESSHEEQAINMVIKDKPSLEWRPMRAKKKEPIVPPPAPEPVVPLPPVVAQPGPVIEHAADPPMPQDPPKVEKAEKPQSKRKSDTKARRHEEEVKTQSTPLVVPKIKDDPKPEKKPEPPQAKVAKTKAKPQDDNPQLTLF